MLCQANPGAARPIPCQSRMATQDGATGEIGDSNNEGLQTQGSQDATRLGPDGRPAPKTDAEYAASQVTIRSILTSKDAGVIIGKGGKNIADLRDETGVKAGVSKVIQGVTDRVLTITGSCDAVSRAYSIVAQNLNDALPPTPETTRGEAPKEGYPRELHPFTSRTVLASPY
jgi:hypothetical protein